MENLTTTRTTTTRITFTGIGDPFPGPKVIIIYAVFQKTSTPARYKTKQ